MNDGNLDLSHTIHQGDGINSMLKGAGVCPMTDSELKITVPANTKIRTFNDLKQICPKFEKVIVNSFALAILSDVKRMMKRIKASYRSN